MGWLQFILAGGMLRWCSGGALAAGQALASMKTTFLSFTPGILRVEASAFKKINLEISGETG